MPGLEVDCQFLPSSQQEKQKYQVVTGVPIPPALLVDKFEFCHLWSWAEPANGRVWQKPMEFSVSETWKVL